MEGKDEPYELSDPEDQGRRVALCVEIYRRQLDCSIERKEPKCSAESH